nr:1-deoxy-D-xylulose-5-phosphate reductoisomerase [Opitutaceae bacterium]
GGAAPAVYNAANEVAVAAFLAGRLPFLGIPRVTEATLAALAGASADGLEAVLAADAEARLVAGERLGG